MGGGEKRKKKKKKRGKHEGMEREAVEKQTEGSWMAELQVVHTMNRSVGAEGGFFLAFTSDLD